MFSITARPLACCDAAVPLGREKMILILKYLSSIKDFVSEVCMKLCLCQKSGLVFLDKGKVLHHCCYVGCDIPFTPCPIFFFSGESDDGKDFTVHTHADAPAMRFGRSGPLDHEPLSGSYT